MKSNNMTVYRLKEDWEPFDKGTEFTYDDDGIYVLRANDKVMAEIPTGLLEVVRNKRWKPGEKDVYYHLYSSGDIGSTVFFPGGDGDEGRLAIGNCFETEEEALSMVKWLKARQNLINSGARFINALDVDSDEVKCFEVYLDGEGMPRVSECYLRKSAVVGRSLCFFNVELARQSLKEHMDDWLTYLGVKKDGDGNS